MLESEKYNFFLNLRPYGTQSSLKAGMWQLLIYMILSTLFCNPFYYTFFKKQYSIEIAGVRLKRLVLCSKYEILLHILDRAHQI